MDLRGMSATVADGLIAPDWPAPAGVRAAATTRHGGVSKAPYASFNLGQHVGDDPLAVLENRRRLVARLGLTREPAWLQQVHGCGVAAAETVDLPAEADAAVTRTPGVACVVMTADCLPVLFCDRDGRVVAAAHAGWRGLVGGVLEATLARMAVEPAAVLAWLGPAIGPAAFEVGPEVRAAFVAADTGAGACFVAASGDRLHADLYALARRRLARVGVTQVFGGGRCTYSETDTFYSYRRSPLTGRQATLIWLAEV